jgi:hypothetical protein
MASGMQRVGYTVVGVAAVLAYWSLKGSGGRGTTSIEGIPTKVWDGGGGTVVVETEGTMAGRFSMTFSERGKADPRSMETWTNVGAGVHSWTVEVPPGVGGYVELGTDTPQLGDRLDLRVRVNGNVVYEDADTLREPLGKGYAFFVQAYMDDYATGALH